MSTAGYLSAGPALGAAEVSVVVVSCGLESHRTSVELTLLAGSQHETVLRTSDGGMELGEAGVSEESDLFVVRGETEVLGGLGTAETSLASSESLP